MTNPQRALMFFCWILLALLGSQAMAEGEDPPNEEEFRAMRERGIASLQPLVGIREGKFAKVVEPGVEPKVEMGTITTRCAPEFGKLGMRIDQLVEVGGKRVESLWLIHYIPYPDEESEERVAGTLVASTFDSLGNYRIYEGKWERGGTVLSWSNEVQPPYEKKEGERLREFKWEFRDDGNLVVTEEAETEDGPDETVAHYRTRPAPAGTEFPSLPATEAKGIMAKLAPLLGRWENRWEAEQLFDGETEKAEGKSALVAERILGGRFIAERQVPDKKGPGRYEEFTIIGAGDGDGDQLRLFFHSEGGNTPPVPATWDAENRGMEIDHVSHPTESITVRSRGSFKFLSDDVRSFESRIQVKHEDGLFENDVKTSGRLQRIKD